MGEDFKYVQAKARPRPKEAEADKKDEAPNIEETEGTTHAEENEDKKSPKKTATLTMNRWGKLEDEKRKRDMAKAPWTKTGRKETTTQEKEEDGERTVTCEEDEAWEPCGSKPGICRGLETTQL